MISSLIGVLILRILTLQMWKSKKVWLTTSNSLIKMRCRWVRRTSRRCLTWPTRTRTDGSATESSSWWWRLLREASLYKKTVKSHLIGRVQTKKNKKVLIFAFLDELDHLTLFKKMFKVQFSSILTASSRLTLTSMKWSTSNLKIVEKKWPSWRVVLTTRRLTTLIWRKMSHKPLRVEDL